MKPAHFAPYKAHLVLTLLLLIGFITESLAAIWWQKSESYACTLETVLKTNKDPEIVAYLELIIIKDRDIAFRYASTQKVEVDKLFLDFKVTQFSFSEMNYEMRDVKNIYIDNHMLEKLELESFGRLFDEETSLAVLEGEKESFLIDIETDAGIFSYNLPLIFTNEFEFQKSLFESCVD